MFPSCIYQEFETETLFFASTSALFCFLCASTQNLENCCQRTFQIFYSLHSMQAAPMLNLYTMNHNVDVLMSYFSYQIVTLTVVRYYNESGSNPDVSTVDKRLLSTTPHATILRVGTAPVVPGAVPPLHHAVIT